MCLGRGACRDGLSLKQKGPHASAAMHQPLGTTILLDEHPVRLRLLLWGLLHWLYRLHRLNLTHLMLHLLRHLR